MLGTYQLKSFHQLGTPGIPTFLWYMIYIHISKGSDLFYEEFKTFFKYVIPWKAGVEDLIVGRLLSRYSLLRHRAPGRSLLQMCVPNTLSFQVKCNHNIHINYISDKCLTYSWCFQELFSICSCLSSMSVSIFGWSLGALRWRLLLLITVSACWPFCFCANSILRSVYCVLPGCFALVSLPSWCLFISVAWCICPPKAELSKSLYLRAFPSSPKEQVNLL